MNTVATKATVAQMFLENIEQTENYSDPITCLISSEWKMTQKNKTFIVKIIIYFFFVLTGDAFHAIYIKKFS